MSELNYFSTQRSHAVRQISKLKPAFVKAARQTAQFMTLELRNEARASGWTPDVVDSIKVSYSNNRLGINIPAKYKTLADDFEFGNSNRQPTGAIRRFANRPEEAEKFLLKSVKTSLRGVL
jgi:hypothetical protein